jgi:hypothetical protein
VQQSPLWTIIYLILALAFLPKFGIVGIVGIVGIAVAYFLSHLFNVIQQIAMAGL